MEELHAMMLGHLAASLKCNVASSTRYWPCCTRDDLTSLPCHSLSLKNDESGIVMIAAPCAKNGDTAFSEKTSAIQVKPAKVVGVTPVQRKNWVTLEIH